MITSVYKTGVPASKNQRKKVSQNFSKKNYTKIVSKKCPKNSFQKIQTGLLSSLYETGVPASKNQPKKCPKKIKEKYSKLFSEKINTNEKNSFLSTNQDLLKNLKTRNVFYVTL